MLHPHILQLQKMLLLPKATKPFPPPGTAHSSHHPLTNESARSQRPRTPPPMGPASLGTGVSWGGEVVQSPPSCFHFPSMLEQNAFFQKRLSSDSPCTSSHTHLPIHNYSHKLPLSWLSQVRTSQF